MPIEKAAEIVRELIESNIVTCSNNHIELFAHFDNFFLDSQSESYDRDKFAQMCGFAVLSLETQSGPI